MGTPNLSQAWDGTPMSSKTSARGDSKEHGAGDLCTCDFIKDKDKAIGENLCPYCRLQKKAKEDAARRREVLESLRGDDPFGGRARTDSHRDLYLTCQRRNRKLAPTL